MITSLPISILTRQRLLLGPRFADQHRHAWLIWEVGSFEPPPDERPERVSTWRPPSGVRLPSKSDPLCFELAQPLIRVGRVDGNDVVIPDATMSRRQFELLHDGTRWSAQVLPSGSPTTVANRALAPRDLRMLDPGDRIQVGATELVFEGPGEFLNRLDQLARRA